MALDQQTTSIPRSETTHLPNWSSWQVVTGTIVVVAIAAAFWFLIRFYELFFMLVVAIILGILIKPAVRWLQEHGMPRIAAALLVYALLFLPILILIWFTAPVLFEQSTHVTDSLVETYGRLHQRLLGSTSFLVRRIAAALPADVGLGAAAPSPANDESATQTSAATLTLLWTSSTQVFHSLLAVLTTLVLTFYWIVESERFQKTFLLLIPVPQRQGLQELGQAIEEKLSRYLTGQLVLCLVIGSLSFVVYLLLGLPNALLLALFAGLMEAVPNVGPIIGAVPALFMAFSISPTAVVGVLVGSGIIQLLENYLLVPRIMGQAMGVRPLVILLAWLAFSSFFGVAGAIVAIPLAVVLQLVVERAVLKPGVLEERGTRGRDRISVIRYEILDLVDDIRQQIRRKEEVATATSDRIEDSIEAIAIDLDSVLAQYDEAKSPPGGQTVYQTLQAETASQPPL